MAADIMITAALRSDFIAQKYLKFETPKSFGYPTGVKSCDLGDYRQP
jgi:hypothetical protein